MWPGAENMVRRCASIGALLNTPVASARPSRSITSTPEAVPSATRQAASATSLGSILARRAYSTHAGCTKIDGWIGSSSPPSFSMNAVHIWRGVMPLARPAAMKPPAETPTKASMRVKSTPTSVSSSAHSAPISQMAPSGPLPASARPRRVPAGRVARDARAGEVSDGLIGAS